MKKTHEKEQILVYFKELLEIYSNNHVPRSAAELSYYLTLSVFPMLICVHAILAQFLPGITLTLNGFKGLVPAETLDTISEYLNYVSAHSTKALLTAGILGMATTSAASFRSIHSIMGDIQGVSRFRGVFAVIFSFAFSLVFLAAIYFGAIVMVAGNWLIKFINEAFPSFYGLEVWSWLRFPLMLVIFVLIIYGIYRITAPRDVHKKFFYGAVAAGIVLVLVSVMFSWLISMSTNYPLIYGSLASIIIFMLWINICGQILIMGNALNVVMRRHGNQVKIKPKDKKI